MSTSLITNRINNQFRTQEVKTKLLAADELNEPTQIAKTRSVNSDKPADNVALARNAAQIVNLYLATKNQHLSPSAFVKLYKQQFSPQLRQLLGGKFAIFKTNASLQRQVVAKAYAYLAAFLQQVPATSSFGKFIVQQVSTKNGRIDPQQLNTHLSTLVTLAAHNQLFERYPQHSFEFKHLHLNSSANFSPNVILNQVTIGQGARVNFWHGSVKLIEGAQAVLNCSGEIIAAEKKCRGFLNGADSVGYARAAGSAVHALTKGAVAHAVVPGSKATAECANAKAIAEVEGAEVKATTPGSISVPFIKHFAPGEAEAYLNQIDSSTAFSLEEFYKNLEQHLDYSFQLNNVKINLDLQAEDPCNYKRFFAGPQLDMCAIKAGTDANGVAEYKLITKESLLNSINQDGRLINPFTGQEITSAKDILRAPELLRWIEVADGFGTKKPLYVRANSEPISEAQVQDFFTFGVPANQPTPVVAKIDNFRGPYPYLPAVDEVGAVVERKHWDKFPDLY